MAKEETTEIRIAPAQVERYLRARGFDELQQLELTPLGQEDQAGVKSYGYGRPLRVSFVCDGQRHQLVLRTMAPDPFGHSLRADRARVLLMSYDTFNSIPHHIRAKDVGALDKEGQLISMARGEIFLLTTYSEGQLYAKDLGAVAEAEAAALSDLRRARALARYLVELHDKRAAPERYRRAVRDTIGSGEGIFGLLDAYPSGHPVASESRLQALEQQAVQWRWRLRSKTHRCRRTHGDFHPFNVLFRADEDFTLLDCSRGAAGDPADDLTAMSINYIFFALRARGSFSGALRQVWDGFWQEYLRLRPDEELLTVAAPFFAWRALVLASPLWYPQVTNEVRDELLRFAERLLAGGRFEPRAAEEVL